MKILTVVGARPQFIKAAALSRKLRKEAGFSEILVHTGQHYDFNMSEVFFREMDIPKPDYTLTHNQMNREDMLGQMSDSISSVLKTETPDLVLVYGDTNSTLAGARAASVSNVSIAHVEAGLRSFNQEMPEEHNRIETDQLSDYLFAPSQLAMKYLKDEGLTEDRLVVNVGDIMLDAIRYYSSINRFSNSQQSPYLLLTLHRAENMDKPEVVAELVNIINELSKRYTIIWPVHPRNKSLLGTYQINAKMIDPVGYFEMLSLIQGAELVLTDSGGLQKEAFYLGKFCITLRQETEWTELVDLGVNRVVGHKIEMVERALSDFTHMEIKQLDNPYGDGTTAEKIISVLRSV